MSWAFKVYADVPDVILSEQGITLSDKPRATVGDWRARGAWCAYMVFEPLLGGVTLQPKLRSDDYEYPAEYYNVYPGAVGSQWITIYDCWGESKTSWLCRRDVLNGAAGKWYAYLSSGAATLAVDQGVYYDMYLLPEPSATVNSRLTSITFYPRAVTSYYVTDPDGSKRYWCPYRAILHADRMVLQEIDGEPSNPPLYTDDAYDDGTYYKTVYEHPFESDLDMGTDFFSKRQRIWFAPAREDQLMVKAGFLKGGGFVYRTELERTGYKMFPAGIAGVEVNHGGASFMQIVPVEYEESGLFYSGEKSILIDGMGYTVADATKTVTYSVPVSGAYIIGNQLIHADTYQPLATDYEFGSFRYRLQVDIPTENPYYTPIIEGFTVGFEGASSDETFTPSYVEDDIISIEESASKDQMGRTVTILLRDTDGAYTAWKNRASLAFDYDWVETTVDPEDEEETIETITDRAMVYLDDVSYDEQNSLIEITCRDGWSRLEEILLPGTSVGDGKQYTDYIEELLLWGGWDEDKIDIYSEDAPTLPSSYDGEDPAWQPEPGQSLAEFIKRLHEEFASQDRMYIAGDGTFTIEQVTPAYVPTPVQKFYWSHEDAEAADDWYATIESNSWRERLLREEFVNLIWVVGENGENGPVIAYYADEDSATNSAVDNYVGEWRQRIYIHSGLRSQEAVNLVCRSLAFRFGKLRKTVEFNSHFYPHLDIGSFVEIDGSDVDYWEVVSMRYTVSAETMYSDDTDGEKVSKCSYELREWVGYYDG